MWSMWLSITIPITFGLMAIMRVSYGFGKSGLAIAIGVLAMLGFAAFAANMHFRCTLPTIMDPDEPYRVLRWACSGFDENMTLAFTFVAAPLSILLLLWMTIHSARAVSRN